MRIKELQKWLRSENIPLAIFFNSGFGRQDPITTYFCDSNFEFGVLVVPAKGNPKLHIPGYEVDRIKKTSPFEVIQLRNTKDTLKKIIKTAKVIGVNAPRVSISLKKIIPCRIKDISQQLQDLRSVKTKEEVKRIKKAGELTIAIFKVALKNWKFFRTEKDVANFLLSEMGKRGLSPSFEPIVASGHAAAIPHHEPRHKLKKGFCVIDFGVKYKGYCSDFTRTVFIGKPSKHQLADYNLLLNSQLKAIDAVKPGIKTKKIHDIAAEHLAHRKHFFIHAVGHGLGLEVHEAPSVGPNSKDILKEGMVITVEPGIYPNHFGIRLEDDIVVTKKGCIVLTKFNKKLICLPFKGSA